MKPFLSLDGDCLAAQFTTYGVTEYRDGATVYGPQNIDQVCIVRSGMVRVSLQSTKGTERLLFFARAGSVLGDALCFRPTGDVPRGIEGVAVGACSVVKVSAGEFRDACMHDATLAMSVITSAYGKISRLIEQLQSAAFRDTPSQIAALIVGLCGETEGSPFPRKVQITHQMLADATGRTRVSVTTALHRLQDSGAIQLGRGYIEVVDGLLLNRHAENEAFQ